MTLNLTQYKLIIFDWDGTLMDSQAHISYCMREAFRDEHCFIPKDDDIAHVIGLSLNKAVKNLLPSLSEVKVQSIADRYRHHFFTTGALSSAFFDGALACLNQLTQAGFYLAVATGKSRRGLDEVLDHHHLHHLFPITRCADETASKPHPLMLQEILTDLDLPAEQAVMVGDTSYDIQMAHNAHMDSIAVTYGVHSKVELEKYAPTYYINHINELIT